MVCIHLEAKTAYLAKVLASGGEEVAVTGSNPHSTKDDVVAALAKEGLHVYARYGATPKEMQHYINLVLDVSTVLVNGKVLMGNYEVKSIDVKKTIRKGEHMGLIW